MMSKTGNKFQSLPDTTQYPLLEDVRVVLDNLCGQPATPDLVARCLEHEKLVQCSDWLNGKWLEEYSLWAIAQISQTSHIGDNYGVDLNPERHGGHKFNLDVAAVRGYQLFAISCMASKKKEKCKEHLLEVYVRARQIGGDEARVGLICCYRDPLALQQEIEETWFTEGRVRVFGMKDLPELPSRLKEWFETANDSQVALGRRTR